MLLKNMISSNTLTIIKFSIVVIFTRTTESIHFSYVNQNKWKNEFPACALKKQSPIELWDPQHSQRVSLSPIIFENYNKYLPTPILYENNGHTVNVIPSKSRKMPTIYGEHLPGKFVLEGFHFHWGSKNEVGSEHTIHGYRYALELHLVHRNVKYKTIKEAIKYTDGLVVIGVLYKANDSLKSFNIGLENIVINLKLMKNLSSNVRSYVTFKLQNLFRNIDLKKYFLYKGSLTTPPCAQSVTWVVMREIENTCTVQMKFFRRLVDDHGIALSNNYRGLQRIGRRRIFFVNF